MINVLTRNNNAGLGWGEGYINPPRGPSELQRRRLACRTWFYKSQYKLNSQAVSKSYSQRPVHFQKKFSAVSFGCYCNWRDYWITLTI
jgi:hypothetical protein